METFRPALVITGVSSGLGLATAQAFVARGYRVFGSVRTPADAARLQALMAAGLARASAVVITYLDVPGALKVLAHIRAHAPQVPVIEMVRGCAAPWASGPAPVDESYAMHGVASIVRWVGTNSYAPES